MQSSELLSNFRRANDREIRPQLVRQTTEEGVDMSVEVGPADSDSFRTANGIRIPDEDIDVILLDNAIDNIRGDVEDEYELTAILKRGGKEKRKKREKKGKGKEKEKNKKRRR